MSTFVEISTWLIRPVLIIDYNRYPPYLQSHRATTSFCLKDGEALRGCLMGKAYFNRIIRKKMVFYFLLVIGTPLSLNLGVAQNPFVLRDVVTDFLLPCVAVWDTRRGNL